jgi:hypothetical protein
MGIRFLRPDKQLSVCEIVNLSPRAGCARCACPVVCPAKAAALLRLAETLTAFLARLHCAADMLSIMERQRIVRLVVRDVLIGDDTIAIRHSIPVLPGPPPGSSLPPSQTAGPNYLLCKGSDFTAAQ